MTELIGIFMTKIHNITRFGKIFIYPSLDLEIKKRLCLGVLIVAGLTIFAGCNSESSEARRIQANLDNLAKIKAENAAKQTASEDELYGTPIEAINVVKTQLKDPFSAQFQNVRHEGLGICGQVNAKNAFGGYVGFRNFYVEKRRSYVEIEGAYSHQFCK